MTYPAGQNDSLESMFAKFATAKNREKLNLLKVCTRTCYLPENNTEDVKMCSSIGTRTTDFRILYQTSSLTNYDLAIEPTVTQAKKY